MFIPAIGAPGRKVRDYCFNPSTGLMFIPADTDMDGYSDYVEFQSLDWVDVYSGFASPASPHNNAQFQSLDWVDVYSGQRPARE